MIVRTYEKFLDYFYKNENDELSSDLYESYYKCLAVEAIVDDLKKVGVCNDSEKLDSIILKTISEILSLLKNRIRITPCERFKEIKSVEDLFNLDWWDSVALFEFAFLDEHADAYQKIISENVNLLSERQAYC